uniref:hypothetical protein n=1 Tax=Vibrio paracholerae TaxID=650003 RepID=UPI001C31488B
KMHGKNATRWLSLLKRLLCLSFNDLRFARTKINSTLTHEQKPKTEMTHNFENQTLNFGS